MKLLIGLLSAGLGALSFTTFAAIELEKPIGGWRDSSMDKSLSESAAAYPKPPVDRGGQRFRTLIKGRLKALGKKRQAPHRYVVNGNSMPLYTDEEGAFVKPWAFGRGSNSVEVRSPDGKDKKRVQFYETSATAPQAKLRIIGAWDDGKAEVDMHIITPDGQHAFWAAPVLRGGGGLDVDSVDGGGPEIFSSAAPRHGDYQVYVNYWGNFDEAGYNFDETRRERQVISVTVSIIYDENTLHERRETYVMPLRNVGDLSLVRAFHY